jgi:gentisate 1,2-dioxygenase
VRAALSAMRGEKGDPHEGITLEFVDPTNGQPVFPTLAYGAQLLRAGEETALKRETCSTVFVALEGRGETEVAGRTFAWEENDIFVIPNFLWRRHKAGSKDAVLYTMSDRPLLEKIGQYRAQGMLGGQVTQLVA